jgi:hypothetical protein
MYRVPLGTGDRAALISMGVECVAVSACGRAIRRDLSTHQYNNKTSSKSILLRIELQLNHAVQPLFHYIVLVNLKTWRI